ncbi:MULTISPECIES: exodeoxyribonuclease V subunit beta [unclassified Pseudomonas]|uniref:exodeoxyribonuclease V subunit beta n=1 Tax=unclassified Pseudomonas TaxID=196821 RepID=UPI000BD90A3C|nr:MULTISPECIES: exodeoxyribonuclease V subunit beta [unclassified Pseudomonas]PVZ08814.1 DNA helicase/exodeoxyribonuclease V beta subunit [Pseudomonas sp. URIL14HWK12:I12]PVZ21236.1 DNA helicase/exodeoxyribonuclease V beta subunit [Pseudomonas sp. URIL14HWK12:I10]PVZ30098.1 DNA helicase/exodeoxyribonuclease V beta subunit [Pseudomonas sp. URIL14HWK12:I11]SNZ18833.1 DNA helicase/exodeoxyribonuclease V, beta subunit [Pseudomonas sp. URIL14HWK12:I9]
MSETLPLALRFPLRGSQLIEASAGTGKTFTISALYLRLVLGHGSPDTAFSEPLLPPAILVVTFTDAATKELRDRIRARLAQAARYFRDECPAPDGLVETLRAFWPAEQWPLCANRLEVAAQWMDEAAVSTIHGWCQRMLREHAFDSGSLFTQTLEPDHSDLLTEVVRDYWRRFCYPLAGPALHWVDSQWGSPDALAAKARPLFASAEPSAGAGELGVLIERELQAREQVLEQLKAPWAEWAMALREVCRAGVAQKQVDGRKMQARFFEPWFDKLLAWAQDPAQTSLDLGTGFSRLTPGGMAEAWKGEPPDHPALHAMQALPGQLAALPDPASAALAHAAAWVRQAFDAQKRQRAEMGFDDMLTRLDHALAGSSGDPLAQLIRQQFPVAMIDEFQDTDPVQYRIFERIYRISANDPGTGLFMIGDPKQAIYAFRGADIHTYLMARRASAGRLHTLGTNFRSTQPMVDAVNHLFQQAEDRPQGRGAFLFRDTDGDNPVPFHPVQAQGRPEQLLNDGDAQPALTCWHLATDQPLSLAQYRRQMADSCASEITRLLNAGAHGTCGFAAPGGPLSPLRPADIAILVRDGQEARLIRQALDARGVRSVYLSDKDSVFATWEALDVLAWLKACAEPDAERSLRAALASLTLGLPLAELERFNQDEQAWESTVMAFRGYRALWHSQGVLAMLRRLMHDYELPRRLAARADGERTLTNLLHLTELLQQASATLDGEQALIRHLAEQLHGGATGEEQILRLESDEQLVKVITVHKSKGLEYPLVFLPFVASCKPVDGKRLPLTWHDDQGHVQLSLVASEEIVARADHERLGEDLRLLYVALTRARHACWLGLADLKRGQGKASVLHQSAIGYVLGGGAPVAQAAGLAQWLEALAAGCPAIAIEPLPEALATPFTAPANDQALRGALAPTRRAAENWWIASYSALRIADGLAADSPLAQKLADDDRTVVPGPQASSGDIHAFPRGPGPGTFLHGLLEWAGEEGFAHVAADRQRLLDSVARRCNRRGWEGWIATLVPWLERLLALPMPLQGAAPASLTGLASYRTEMEFWFASDQVDVSQLDALVQRHTHPGLPRASAMGRPLNGLFKGFIDLCFEHEGRYYVADYKSNWLGPDASAYQPAAMEQVMLEHRYDLQYVLYLLALHRQLTARLPGYDYDEHVGGALFIFLRGLDAPGQGVCHVRPPKVLIEALDALFMGRPLPMEALA